MQERISKKYKFGKKIILSAEKRIFEILHKLALYYVKLRHFCLSYVLTNLLEFLSYIIQKINI